ncbi:MFS general substrate transporter [Eremomyces bilateralis CBS 781.70]|uniref:MFS general substrate transporter n=1 Tax=Eremomyces bilateralis CBS 781.70 TaxID=1392243 RepID=A0A6G1G7Y1_9PEZI|nr:MFS general substrate transporter [Eremomyces bilateralis CBS 781.70]KAF1814143.1 MFS general substrate transporter [Eremomyces bilateralis CBS 781.70]
MAQQLGALIEVKSDKPIQNPPIALTKRDATPSQFELEFIPNRNPPSIPHTPYGPPPERENALLSGQISPTTPNDLERNRDSPPNSIQPDAASLVQTWRTPSVNKWRILACCLEYMGNGMNDSAPGALIPYLEKFYSIGYAIVSLVFVANAVGFIAAAFFTNTTLLRLGRSKTLMLSEIFLLTGCVALACSPPFPVVVIAFFLFGYGMATNLALNNVFCANLADSSVILGLAHGSYGVGGIVAPIIATTMVSNGMVWSRFYIITIAVRVIALIATGLAFRGYEADSPSQPQAALQTMASQQGGTTTPKSTILEAIKQRTTIMGALFLFAYQGAEVAISGWVISFLLDYRDGTPSSVGYVTAGFWGGITVGRFFVTPLLKRLGESKSVYLLGILSIVFQVLTWQIPSLISSAVSVSILGVLLGPIYPCATTIFARMLDHRLQTAALGFISSAGSSGGAIGPFLIGGLAGWKGVWVMHPVCIGLFGLMLGSFYGLPRTRKRTE